MSDRLPGTDLAFEIEADSDVRLDSLVAARAELSRTQAATLIANGHVSVSGRREKASYKPVAGERVVVHVPPPAPREIRGESIPLDIVHEDDDLVVVNKPAGMVVHPAPGNWSGTLVNALVGRATCRARAATSVPGSSIDWTRTPRGSCSWPRTTARIACCRRRSRRGVSSAATRR